MAFLFTLFLTACDNPDPKFSIDGIRSQGELIVLTRNAPTVYYFDRDGNGAGLDHDLIQAFAKHHQLKVRLEVRETVDEILTDLRNGKAHIAAAGLTETTDRTNNYLASTPYQTVTQQVVCRRGGKQPKNIKELDGVSLTVIAESSYASQLKKLNGSHPALSWRSDNDIDTEALLEQVWDKEIDCTVADSNIVAINRRYQPELVTPFDLSDKQSLVFYLPPQAKELQNLLNSWLDEFKETNRLSELLEKYYGFVEIFDYVDTRKYVDRITERLPKYEAYFKEAAEQNDLPWTLLAAQAYQESHWNPNAKSPTGVRGIMMLTRITAKEVGVTSRLDAQQSIAGGAKYLNNLRKRLPKEIEEPDRSWFALAAYNVGMGHLRDARTLAKNLEKDPNRWADLKEVLPLLSKKKYYKKLKYGYARGNEPLQYVTRIRNFEDILLQKNGE
jgi:membrane-bound lytic murein transglycosylase F